MSNGKFMIVHLIDGLIKKFKCDFIEISMYKNEQIFS